MLKINDLKVNYGSICGLHGISLNVPQGKIVTLIGANGAGKSTALRAISGLVKPKGGQVIYDSEDITGKAAHLITAKGLSHVPEGRMIFANMTVRENLLLGAYLRRDHAEIDKDNEFVLETFPRLRERFHQSSGTLSGGEQQMLAIGRALMSKPRCLMLDEPSLGIAPILVRAIFDKLVEINSRLGLTILLVEQNANLALKISHYGYVLETGRILMEGSGEELRQNPQVREAYLGG